MHVRRLPDNLRSLNDADWFRLLAASVTQPAIIDLCADLGVPGRPAAIHPLGPLPYPDGFFDGVQASSAFTHLPEHVHVHWAAELARVCRPGGVVCLTLESRRFLDTSPTCPSHRRERAFPPTIRCTT